MSGLFRILFGARRAYYDTRSIERGTYPKRLARRVAYRTTGRVIRSLFR